MNKVWRVIIFLAITATIVFLGLYLIGFLKPKGAGIFIDTIPLADIYIDGVVVGGTPYEAIRNPGEIVVKIIPQDSALVSFETKVSLVSNIRTVIKREFAQTDEASSGEIASFEKVGGKDASVSIVTIPDAAQISINGQIRAFAPYKINSILPGEHVLTISKLGYQERTLTINAYEGYKLTVVVKLAEGDETLPQPTATPANQDLVFKRVLILETPNNFLRVRSEPSTDGKEIARVTSGSKYNFIEEDSKNEWYKIYYEEGKEGWISSEYSEIVEE